MICEVDSVNDPSWAMELNGGEEFIGSACDEFDFYAQQYSCVGPSGDTHHLSQT
jgi:hypothetical protein